ncbi:BglII/BstYI family type II restriction endonuclease [Bradyrhizobium sp. CCBAU 11357]|uniref:BglII/BstYI family type II restriction endonuclease n=1 Tax=Bradyrhizobium sp. CCBAU 11357 TaxID=1630808 RepID=UPI0023021514|nr:BglII/BstYI family type II restriction endonuclease [Bradyrhizobium sp. CCBAU 11357]MDA9499547.1 restriction endonuclease BglII [Bradyrhizobium sp. CCBAU 11357]
MDKIRLERFSFRFAEQLLNSKLAVKQEIETILTSCAVRLEELSRPSFNKTLRHAFVSKGWTDQPYVFADEDELGAKMDFLKDRVGIEVGFGHASFIGIDLLKFQVSSYSALDQIDVGVYIATTKRFQKHLATLGQNWEGSLTFEKITRYLPQFKSAIQVPIYVLGIDV